MYQVVPFTFNTQMSMQPRQLTNTDSYSQQTHMTYHSAHSKVVPRQSAQLRSGPGDAAGAHTLLNLSPP